MFRADFPCVHLHKIHLNRIKGLSSMDLQGISSAVIDKLSVYLYPDKNKPSRF